MKIDGLNKDRILFFQKAILFWFDEYRREFPWRGPDLSPYQIIISEILLQRTKAETVSKFYDEFISNYPDWQSLYSASLADIQEYLRPVGLQVQRSIRLHKLAEYMVKNDEVLPKVGISPKLAAHSVEN